jgi:hypothetical protein
MIQQRDVPFMKDDDNWPIWPILPVQRVRRDGAGKGWPQLGVMVPIGMIADHKPVVIFLVSLYDKFDETTPRAEYDSAESAVADGWAVG